MEKVKIFIDRLSKIGIEVTISGNYPWLYLSTINGRTVTEKFHANHGYTIGFYSDNFKFLDITDLFKIIRKYR